MLPEAKKTNVRQNRSTRAVDPGRYISSQWGFNSRAYNGAAPCWRVHQYGKWGAMKPGEKLATKKGGSDPTGWGPPFDSMNRCRKEKWLNSIGFMVAIFNGVYYSLYLKNTKQKKNL